jgi:urease accessory protein
MGETVRNVHLHDRWRIRRDGRLIFADDLLISGAVPETAATLKGARSIATVLLVSPRAESLVERARSLIGDDGSASAWSGKLVARLLAGDGFSMRKRLIPLLRLLSQGEDLPKVWSL